MNAKMRGFVNGMLLGVVGKPFPITQEEREPVAYLYGYATDNPDLESYFSGNVFVVGGVKYAGIITQNIDAVWDKGTFPYAYATRGGHVYLTDAPAYYTVSSGNLYLPAGTKYRLYLASNFEKWTANTVESDRSLGSHYDVQWSSTNIVAEDGSLVRATTKPIPIGDVVGKINTTVQLPDVEGAWTDELRARFPYAHVRRDKDSTRWYLFITSTPGYEYEPGFLVYFRAGTEYRFGGVEDNRWKLLTGDSVVTKDGPTGSIFTPHEITWASYDMDGYSMKNNSLVVPVSIPVYE